MPERKRDKMCVCVCAYEKERERVCVLDKEGRMGGRDREREARRGRRESR